MDITLEEIDPAGIERARQLMLFLHQHEMAVQPSLGSAPQRSDEEFWNHYSGGFERWYAYGGFAAIAVVEGSDAGFIFCTEREGLFGFHSSERIGYVEDIVVSPGARTGGVGRILIDAARAEFRSRGYSHFELSSVPGNEQARDFYRRLGLEPAGVLMIGDV
ncbi:MAG: GNAT family N-acetyltransferase [Solirubrobacterales bacterium]|nr:GNAT family N-acetyltransferase [Solirubrobacterales bacterium]